MTHPDTCPLGDFPSMLSCKAVPEWCHPLLLSAPQKTISVNGRRNTGTTVLDWRSSQLFMHLLRSLWPHSCQRCPSPGSFTSPSDESTQSYKAVCLTEPSLAMWSFVIPWGSARSLPGLRSGPGATLQWRILLCWWWHGLSPEYQESPCDPPRLAISSAWCPSPSHISLESYHAMPCLPKGWPGRTQRCLLRVVFLFNGGRYEMQSFLIWRDYPSQPKSLDS